MEAWDRAIATMLNGEEWWVRLGWEACDDGEGPFEDHHSGRVLAGTGAR